MSRYITVPAVRVFEFQISRRLAETPGFRQEQEYIPLESEEW